jgi:hypothetical protein
VRILPTLLISCVSWMVANIMTESLLLLEAWQNCKMQIFYGALPEFFTNYFILIFSHCHKIMKLVGSHGSLSCLFIVKVMVWHFVQWLSQGYLHSVLCCLLNVVLEMSLQSCRYAGYMIFHTLFGSWWR